MGVVAWTGSAKDFFVIGIWAALAGFARRIVAPEQAGRALAIAMAGTPVALSIGTPLGAWFGSMVGWRWSFAGVSVPAAAPFPAAPSPSIASSLFAPDTDVVTSLVRGPDGG